MADKNGANSDTNGATSDKNRATTRRSSRSNPMDDDAGVIRCHNVECARVIRLDNNDSHVTCAMCRRPYHLKCTRLSSSGYNDYTKLSEIKWFCPPCDKQSEKVFLGIFDLKVSHDKLEKSHQELVNRVEVIENDDLKTRVEELEQGNLEARVKQLEHGQGAAASSSSVAATRGPPSTTFASSAKQICKRSVNAAISEWRDIEYRKQNVVLFGVPESTSDDPETAKAEDKDYVKDVLAAMENGSDLVGAVNIQSVLRVGPDGTDGRPKALKVVFDNPAQQQAVLKSAPSLHNHATFGRVFVRPDLTKLQREYRREKRQRSTGFGTRVFMRSNNRGAHPSGPIETITVQDEDSNGTANPSDSTVPGNAEEGVSNGPLAPDGQ